jgi:hypothetical protein
MGEREAPLRHRITSARFDGLEPHPSLTATRMQRRMMVPVAEPALPDDVDPALWFRGACGQVDYLVRDNAHTHPGRLTAYCPHRPDHPDYDISINQLGECAEQVRWWAEGFVIGSEPGPPLNDSGFEVEEDDSAYQSWSNHRAEYRRTGVWPNEVPRGQ